MTLIKHKLDEHNKVLKINVLVNRKTGEILKKENKNKPFAILGAESHAVKAMLLIFQRKLPIYRHASAGWHP